MAFLSRPCTTFLALTNFAEALDDPFQDEAVQLLQQHVGKVHHSLLQEPEEPKEPLQALSAEIQEALKRLPETAAGKDLTCAPVDEIKVSKDSKYAGRVEAGQCNTPAGMWNDEDTGKLRLAKYKAIAKFLGVGSTHSVVDWGTGCGTEIADVATDTGVHATGIDIEEALITWANANVHVPNTQFCVTDGASLPFESGSADAIISNGVLFHVGGMDEEQKSIQEMLRVLRPGGCAWHGYLGDLNHDKVTIEDWKSATIPGAIHSAVKEKDVFEHTEYGTDSYSLVFCKQ